MAMLAGASAAQDDARARAMAAHGASGSTAVVTGASTVPVLAALGWHMQAPSMRVAVRLP
jgi:hypothetical protein